MDRATRALPGFLAALLLLAATLLSQTGTGVPRPAGEGSAASVAWAQAAASPVLAAVSPALATAPRALAAAPDVAPAAAEPPPFPEPLAASLDRGVGQQVQAALANTAALGVHVVDVATGETVYAYNPDDLRIVASNTKLFTTAAALEAFGPGHLFETRLLLRGPVRDGVLAGDLGVVGGGDPNISGRFYDGDSFAVFRAWAWELAARGVRRVSGDLYLAHGLFEPTVVHPRWPADQLASWYEAPVAALSFNDNCILVRVSPTRAGQRARVETVPPVAFLQVESSARTVAKGRARLAVGRSGDLLTVSGSLGAGAGPFDTWVTVPDPVAYFGEALVAALAEEGIAFSGRLRQVADLPGPVWERVAVHRSDLVTAIEVTNKRSQNFYAESLLKQLAARRCGGLGSWREGVRAVEEYLESIGVPEGSFRMSDGSGMSRDNLFAPRQVTQLLRHMARSQAGPEFARSLPYGGEDNGGWKRRLAAPPYRGNVFAKTGTLNGVSALSGYAKALSGRTYAFAILSNRVRSGADAKRAEDRIVMAVVDNG